MLRVRPLPLAAIGVEAGRCRTTNDHTTALQEQQVGSASSTTSRLGKKSLPGMNALVNNVAYALFAAGPLPMLGPGADMRRLHGFQRGKAWTATALKTY